MCLPLDRDLLPLDLDLVCLPLDLDLVTLPLDLDLDLLLLLLGLGDLLLVLLRLLDPFSPWGNMLRYSSAGSLLALVLFLTTYPNLSSSTSVGALGAQVLA